MSSQTNPTPRPAPSDSTTTASGRDAAGRFAPGNPGGPGNPYARQVAALRQALCSVVTEQDMIEIGHTLMLMARNGNLAAIKLLFSYVIGKPTEAVNPDALDVDEWKLQQQVVSLDDFATVMHRLLPSVANRLAGGLLPILNQLNVDKVAKYLGVDEEPRPRRKRKARSGKAEATTPAASGAAPDSRAASGVAPDALAASGVVPEETPDPTAPATPVSSEVAAAPAAKAADRGQRSRKAPRGSSRAATPQSTSADVPKATQPTTPRPTPPPAPADTPKANRQTPPRPTPRPTPADARKPSQPTPPQPGPRPALARALKTTLPAAPKSARRRRRPIPKAWQSAEPARNGQPRAPAGPGGRHR